MATPSTDAPVSPLRQRMQHDMLMRGLGSHTRQDYVRHVRCFAAFLGRSPDTATPEDIRRFQLDQHENGVGPATINGAVSALRFQFLVILQRRDLSRALVISRYHRKLPDVLSVEEAGRLLEAAPGLKYKAALGVAYGAGLRVSEVAHLVFKSAFRDHFGNLAAQIHRRMPTGLKLEQIDSEVRRHEAVYSIALAVSSSAS